jgi:hypothetical protein
MLQQRLADGACIWWLSVAAEPDAQPGVSLVVLHHWSNHVIPVLLVCSWLGSLKR